MADERKPKKFSDLIFQIKWILFEAVSLFWFVCMLYKLVKHEFGF